MVYNAYEKQANGSLLLLNVLGEYNGKDASDNPIIQPLNISNVGTPASSTIPLAPTASGLLNSRTSATINWAAPDNTNRPPITEYRIYRADDGGLLTYISTVSATTFSYTDSPLPTNTPEILFTYVVRAVNADGVGDVSNVVSLQYNSTPTQGPTAPTSLTVSEITQVSARLNWVETTNTAVTKHGIFKGDVLIIDNLDSSAVTYVWTGLGAGVQQANVNVRRYVPAFGWSPASNAVTFTTLTGSVSHDIAMGASPEGSSSNTSLSWDAIRVYRLSQAKQYVTRAGARILALTDDPNVPQEGGASSATILENFLEDWYYGSGSSARQDVEVHFANSNEQPRDYQSGSLPSALINTYALMYAVVHKTVSGVRRYPKASMWVNMTNYTISNKGAGPRFKVIAPYLDGMSCSMYPGMLTTATGVVAWSVSAYANSIDDVISTLVDWRTVNPSLNQFATWEVGTPIDRWNTTVGSNYGEPTATSRLSIRPRFYIGGRDETGTNWAGFMNYLYNKCDTNGIIMREQCWWDSQVGADGNPYYLYHDKARTTPDMETAWRNWVPGVLLPNA